MKENRVYLLVIASSILFSSMLTGCGGLVVHGGASVAGPHLTVNAGSVAFGTIALHTTSTQSIVFTSTGTTPVTISSANASGTGFSVSGINFPVTLSPAQQITLFVQFDPAAMGAVAGQVTVKSNSITEPALQVTLSGTGMGNELVASNYQVNLTWVAPPPSTGPISGYNIYRSSSNSAYQLLATVNGQTAYTDGNVASGAKYAYYTTTVDASGAQSLPSNLATVAIP